MHPATRGKDEQILKAHQQQFASVKMKWTMEGLLCDGCLGNGRRAVFCRTCAIRECATKKSKEKRCADRSKFGCAHITGLNNDGMLHDAEVLENSRQLRTIGIKDCMKRKEERWQYSKCR
jgi:hypothetical protein